MKLINRSLFSLAACGLSFCLFGTFGFSQARPHLDSSLLDEKEFWLEKVARTLRNGEGLNDQDDLDELLEMDEDAVIDQMMADPRFGDAVLRFNLYFLGRGIDQVRDPATQILRPDVWRMPQAVSSAHEVVTGGDYFRLFDSKFPVFVEKLGTPYWGGPRGPQNSLIIPPEDQEVLSPEKILALRTLQWQGIDQRLARSEVIIREANDNNQGLLCQSMVRTYNHIHSRLVQAGFPLSLRQSLKEKWLFNSFFEGYYNNPVPVPEGNSIGDLPDSYCYISMRSKDPNTLLHNVRTLRTQFKTLFTKIESSPPTKKGLGNLKNLIPLNLAGPDSLALENPAFTTGGFWTLLPNSSTNFNRKRASHILKTFLCDDMTPIDIASGGKHEGNRHASDPACQSCHYKLDPMAGLFRFNGIGGNDFEKSSNYGAAAFVFDDFLFLSKEKFNEYLSNWTDQTNKLQVGYYTSPGKAHADWQGTKLNDLFSFLGKAKEVRSCVVRRLAEFTLGPEQVYDRGWLEEIGSTFKPGVGSGDEMKSMWRKLLKSETFKQRDPVKGECYDFAAGSAEKGAARPPCAVAFLTETYCAQCHQTSGKGLNVLKWVDTGSGVMGFEHRNKDGMQLTAEESFRSIKNRIITSDPNKRMPRGGAFPDTARQTLYHWLNQKLGE